MTDEKKADEFSYHYIENSAQPSDEGFRAEFIRVNVTTIRQIIAASKAHDLPADQPKPRMPVADLTNPISPTVFLLEPQIEARALQDEDKPEFMRALHAIKRARWKQAFDSLETPAQEPVAPGQG